MTLFNRASNYIIITLAVLWTIAFSSCGFYSLSGISIEEEKTIQIDYFPNKARIVAPVLSPIFTEKLQDKFSNESPLELVDREADITITGSIVNYSVSPAASGGDDLAQLNRLTIGISVNYYNRLKDEKWNQTFSQFEDFEQETNLKDVEDELIESISDLLVIEIFNKALVNW